MAIHEGGTHIRRRGAAATLGIWLAVGLAGCASSQGLDLGETHPANPRAAAARMTASTTFAEYRTPQDFAARLAADASVPAAEGHGAAHGGETQVAQASAPQPGGVGTVNAVNAERRTLNLSHEPIASLGWPAMTMDLPVAPSVDLTAVRPGSRVRFTLRRGADGLYAIDSLAPAPGGPAAPPAGGSMPGHGGMGGSMPGHGSGTRPPSGGHQ